MKNRKKCQTIDIYFVKLEERGEVGNLWKMKENENKDWFEVLKSVKYRPVLKWK